MILGGETYDGRRRGGWYALWSQVQPAPGVVGDCWQCLARLWPEKRRTPGICKQTCSPLAVRACLIGGLGHGKGQGHLPETLALVTLPERCRNGLVVAGYRCKGRIGYALGQQRWGRAKQTIAPLDMVVEAEKRGAGCQRIQRQAKATQLHAGRIDIHPIQAVAYDIVEGLTHDFRGRRLLTGAHYR